MSIHADIEAIAALKKKVFEHINYTAKWEVYPLDDQRAAFWATNGDVVRFCPTKEKLLSWMKEGDDSGACYSEEVVRNGVYRGTEITGIEVNTHTDGNKFLALFRNENELAYEDYEERDEGTP